MDTRYVPRRDPVLDDFNVVASGLLDDLAAIQSMRQKTFAYGRAAAAILALDRQFPELVTPSGSFPPIAGIGPSSTRVLAELLAHGVSATVEGAVEAAGARAAIAGRRALRNGFLSRARALAVLRDSLLGGPAREDYGGDFQMHTAWSDGKASAQEMADACRARGYRVAALTDHAFGLKIARGMSMTDARRQRIAVDAVNASATDGFRLLQGIEANIAPDGALDLGAAEAGLFDLVLAAPHSQLRQRDDQTARMMAAVRVPHVHVLAHPRGRVSGERAGVVADWDAVFAAAADAGVAVEIDGDPARQDLDAELAVRALDAGCLFAVDSDAHTPGQLAYADIALAHALLAAIPPARIVNCWPLDDLLTWTRTDRRHRPRRR